MAPYAVLFTPEAQQQLLDLYRYIAQHGSPLTAQRYTDAIISTCESLARFPMRGVARDDIRPGLRLTHVGNPPFLAVRSSSVRTDGNPAGRR